MNRLFHNLAETAQHIAETRGTNAKTGICADFFLNIDDDNTLELAAQFLGEGAFSAVSGKRAAVGSRTYSTAAADFCEISYEKVFKPCKTALGSATETIEKLMHNIEAARHKRSPERLTLDDVRHIYEQLYRASSRSEKQQILKDTWSKMTPVEIKYFLRILSQGSLRIGFETRSVVSAIAEAFDKDPEKVRYAHMITGSIGKTVVLSRRNKLGEAELRLFQPLSFMLASPAGTGEPEEPEAYIAEEKFDGMRAQVHVGRQKVEVYSRDLNDVTGTFPEVAQFFLSRKLPDLVLDGEICVFKEKEILPFQMLQKRMGRKNPGKKVMNQYPVLFIAYDLLFYNDRPIFELTLTQRRKILEQLARKHAIPVTSQFEVESRQQIENLYDRAIAHGNEGIMLKKKDSTYEYGQRRKSWLKVKKPGGTLDTVVMYAHAGSGKRGGYYSDFTLGISVKEDERYEEEFIPIGKAYGGYTDEEMKRLNKLIKDLTVEKYGPTLALKPEIVVEIEFDDIQMNKRTKANYTLRLPRFKAIRWDLGPGDADTLIDVERLYDEKINRERLKQDKNPSFFLNS